MPSTIGTPELVIMELLMLAVPVILLLAFFYVVRRAVEGGVRRAMGGPQTSGETSAKRCSGGATPAAS